jgi:hypothetical protein
MDSGTIMLGVFFGIWIGWMIFFGLRKSNGVVVFGGGFIAACVALIIGFQIESFFVKDDKVAVVTPAETTPNNTSVVKKPVWSKDEARINSKETYKLIIKAKKDLDTAIETGDSAGFVEYVTRPLYGEADKWNQHDYPAEFEPCRSAAIDLHAYAMTMYNEHLSDGASDGVQNRKNRTFYEGQFKEDMPACKKISRS